MNIILTSNNKDGIKELKEILGQVNIDIIPLNINENNNIFMNTSLKKALELYEIYNLPVMFDNSGLSLDYLNKIPDAHSVRHYNPYITEKQNVLKLLKDLDGVPFKERTAKFISILVFVLPNKRLISIRRECKGYILNEPKVADGLEYSTIFFYEPLGKTFAELTDDEKNTIIPRKLAINQLKRELERFVMLDEGNYIAKDKSVLSLMGIPNTINSTEKNRILKINSEGYG
jgi:XTP/dITP diphosphohydrolase